MNAHGLILVVKIARAEFVVEVIVIRVVRSIRLAEVVTLGFFIIFPTTSVTGSGISRLWAGPNAPNCRSCCLFLSSVSASVVTDVTDVTSESRDDHPLRSLYLVYNIEFFSFRVP